MLDAAGDRPVVFRTVDIGGDKALPYLRSNAEDEENPAMGWRALRMALERDGLMKAQARALIEAARFTGMSAEAIAAADAELRALLPKHSASSAPNLPVFKR